jgi:hypothetical protein
MIKKYSDFLNENLEFIIESNVVYSDNFRKAMAKIDSPVAKAILGAENNDLTVQANYLDIEFSKNDTITFTPDRKAQEILGDTKEVVRFTGSGGGWLKHKDSNSKLFEQLGYTYEEGSEPYKPNSRDLGEVVAKVTSETSGSDEPDIMKIIVQPDYLSPDMDEEEVTHGLSDADINDLI